MSTRPVLHYVHDPMCSWCWGFRKTWASVVAGLAASIRLKYVLGGLAVDTEVPMPEAMRMRIRDTWKRIQEEVPGTEFNYDFWSRCIPRRSTYPACRAIVAARQQIPDADTRMLLAIQRAYYLEARNPSDTDVLVGLAGGLGLETTQFQNDLHATATRTNLLAEFKLRRELGVNSFPGLVLTLGHRSVTLPIDYISPQAMLSGIHLQAEILTTADDT